MRSERRTKYGTRSEIVDLDVLDTTILRQLLHDSRTTNRAIAAAAGVSPTTALDRTRRLERLGIIRGSSVEVDLDAIGRGVQALVSVRVRPPTRERIEGFRDWASARPEVLGLFVTSGSEDFLLHLAVRDNDAVYAFVVDQLTSRREIADVRTSFVYEHVRNLAAPLGGPAATG